MKIYMLCDMEGISGIWNNLMTDRTNPEYAEGRRLMMDDMNVTIDALFANGATEVVACDTHGGGNQVRVREMDERAVYEMPAQARMMPSLDESFDGVVLLGHHAMAGTLNGFLDHTMNSRVIFEYRLNGKALGEIGIEAAFAGHYKVPVIMVQGDKAACKEAKALFGKVAVAQMKEGLGRNKAKCLSIPKAHDVLRKKVAEAMKNIKQYKPYRPKMPGVMQMTVYRSDMGDGFADTLGMERVNARTFKRKVTSLLDVFRWS